MNHLIIKIIRFYQITLSAFIGQHCRFTPTCSNYAIKAISNMVVAKRFVSFSLKEYVDVILGLGGVDEVPKEMNNRFLLYIAFSLVLFMIWQQWQIEQSPASNNLVVKKENNNLTPQDFPEEAPMDVKSNKLTEENKKTAKQPKAELLRATTYKKQRSNFNNRYCWGHD
jgi:putative membrane protein insertion efficiency factor